LKRSGASRSFLNLEVCGAAGYAEKTLTQAAADDFFKSDHNKLFKTIAFQKCQFSKAQADYLLRVLRIYLWRMQA
jgi:hypothetical protein